ncbi:HlyD family type I secretion periplasmic adaptor subunit [Phormidesmis priestleyi]
MQKLDDRRKLNSPNSFTSRQPSRTSVEESNWSPSLQSVLDQPPIAFPFYLVLGGVAFCVAFAAWAYFGQIDEVGHARGQLVPKGSVYKIHPVESGKVTKLLVREGQLVKAGQTLAELDPQLSNGEVDRLQQTLASHQTQLNQMQMLIARSRLEAQQRTESASANSQGQTAVIAQSTTRVSTTREILSQLRADESAQRSRLEKLRTLASQGAISQERLFEVEQALRDRQSGITKSQGDLEQALSEVKQLRAGLDQKQADGTRSQLEAQQQTQQLEVEATQLKAKIAETQTLLTTAKAKSSQRLLVAPVAGTVSSLGIQNVGEVVQPGQTIAEMSALKVPLVLRASLPNQEAGFVEVGMAVQIKLDAYPYQDYGMVSGKVISISPDAKSSDRSEPVYQVEIALDRTSITANQKTISFKAGQAATAELVIRRRRIIDVLFEPIRQLQKGGIHL